jgi:hypothetical protein
VHVRLERHQRATAADLEELLLYEQARLVGEGQHAQRSAEEHVGKGGTGAVSQELHVNADAVVALGVELEKNRLDGVDGVLLKVVGNDDDDLCGRESVQK